MLEARVVKDTYESLRDGIRKIFSLADKKTKTKVNLSLKAYSKGDTKPKINWDNKKEREELLCLLISDVKEVLSHIDVNSKDVDTQLKDADSDIITNIDVSAGNCPDQDMARPLIKGAEGKIAKTFVFSKETCNDCPQRSECSNAKNTGRTLTVGRNEEYLQKAREIQKTEEFREIYNKIRPPVERKIAELIFHDLCKTRYIGKKKSRLQALFTAAAVNLKRLFKEEQEEKINLDIVGAISVTTWTNRHLDL